MTTQHLPIMSQAGIKRDGTKLEGDYYIDGQWVRFQRGKPRKIGGYRTMNNTDVPEIARGINSFSTGGFTYIHIGTATEITQYKINSDGNVVLITIRTPVGFAVDSRNLWQFDIFTDVAGSGNNYLIAHAGKNLTDIDNADTSPIYAGLVDDTAILDTVPTSALTAVSGGIVAVGVFLFSYGSDGLFFRTGANDLSTNSNEGNVTAQKIVKGLPLRGAGSGPAAIFWSLDSVIRATFGTDSLGATLFSFDTLNTQTSILSSQSVIENDGIFYWIGVDRFLMFNGVVRDIPNVVNQNFFFDNLNFDERQKVFAFKVPRFGEIWWCYPRGTATECTHAIIYNTREQSWYDTELPDGGRSIGIYAHVFRKPIMFDVDLITANSSFTMWQHETGADKAVGQILTPVQSFFETTEQSFVKGQPGSDAAMRVSLVEPDFVQTGDLTMTVRGRQNGRDTQQDLESVTFNDSPTTASETTLKLKKSSRRWLSFKFESNTLGGNFELGVCIAHVDVAGERVDP